MKQFKDYAHLYIGCEATTPNGVGQIHTAAISGIVAVCFRGAAKPYEAEKVKPHLRRLESMTEEQAQQLDVAMWEDDGPMATGLLDRDGILKQFEWATDSDYRLCFGTYIKAANWLRKNKFDCDDLIDAGLAIDAATLTQK